MAAREQPTEEELEAIEAEARKVMAEPVVWYPAPAAEATGHKARLLRARHGMAGLGRLYVLRGRLAAEEGHRFNVADEAEAALLAEDLGMDAAELRPFLADLAELGFIDAEILGLGRVACTVVDECAMRRARKVAYGRVMGASRGGRPKKKDEEDDE